MSASQLPVGVPFGGAPGVVTLTGSSTAGSATSSSRSDHAHGYNPPACRVNDSANQSVTNNTLTDLTFANEDYDTNSMHDTVTNNQRITINTAGLYLVTGWATFSTDTDITEVLMRLLVDGAVDIGQTRVAGTLSGIEILSIAQVYKFSAAQYVTLNVRQTNTSAGANNVGARAFSATWIGVG